jgi:NAD(P)-dependent dehydrogenase (short-subunit alcohol dehydrogenase family)
VTGGSRGLGLQCAAALGDMGAKVVITSRKASELDKAAEFLSGRGIECLAITSDLQKLDQIPGLVDTALDKYNKIDILINNAGATWGEKAEDYPADAWRKVMSLNVDSVFFLSQAVGKRSMIPNKYGKIINISSIAGLAGNPEGMNTIAYNTSKGAIINFTKTLAAEWGKYNINVNTICPGFFPTKMSAGLLQKDGFKDHVLHSTPLRRMGGDTDMMGTTVYLASEASRHVTGQYIAVDGGSSII